MGANAQTTVPTFVAGQVLTAEQQRQSAGTGVPVFADTTARDAGFGGTGEKTLAEGQLCYLESTNVVQYYDGAAWATVGPSTSGFVYITGAAFTAASAVNVNSCFTSTYRNYALVYELSGSTSLTLSLRFRVSGADDANANYLAGGQVTRTVSGASSIQNDSSTSFTVGLTSSGDAARRVRANYTIYAPQLALRTGISGTITSAGASNSEFGGGYYGGEFTNTTVFDGFSLIASTGTITGTYRVYGLADS